ncbi:MAG: helix-turn-helix domain-containing protein, partial [bacterium]
MTVSAIQLGKVVDVSAGQPAPKPNDFSDDGFPFIRAGSLEGLLSGQTENDCEKIDAETARRYVNGRSVPSVDFVARLAEASGVSVSWLITGNGPRDEVLLR